MSLHNLQRGNMPSPPSDGDSMESRLAKIEAIIPTLATKSDVADVRTDIHKADASHVKWSIGIGIAVVGLIVAYLNLSKVAAPMPQPQPIVIQLPQTPLPAAPVAKAPAPKTP